MKRLLLILLLFVTLIACKGQTPKVLNYYSVATYDSLKAVAAYRVTLMADKDRTIARRNATIDTLNGKLAIANETLINNTNTINSQANTITTQTITINRLQDTINQLRSQSPCEGIQSGDIVDVDTFDLQIINTPGNSFKVIKTGGVIKTETIHGPKRVGTTFIPPYDFDTWVQDSTFTRYSNHLDLRSGY